MRAGWSRVRSSLLVRNALSLCSVQASRKIVPLISFPYLARVLGAAGWGHVAFLQAVADFILLFVEFGFSLSSTREVARHRDSRQTCGRVLTGTLAAQCCLTIPVVLAAWVLSHWIPLIWASVAYGLAQSFVPLWFFQGLERMAISARLEIGSKVLALLGILIFVHHPGDEWKVLALMAAAQGLAAVTGLLLAYRLAPFTAPTWRAALEYLRAGWPMFLMRSGYTMYSTCNVLLLGLFAPARIVGYYASAEKLVKAACGLLQPIRDSIYPRLSHLALHDPSKAGPLTRLGALIMCGGGLLLGAITYLGAPYIAHLLLGGDFGPSVPILRILALLPPITALAESVGMQSLLPLGRESTVTRVILCGGAFNCLLAVLLAPRWQHIGMAWSVVSAEALVCAALVTIALRATAAWGNPDLLPASELTV